MASTFNPKTFLRIDEINPNTAIGQDRLFELLNAKGPFAGLLKSRVADKVIPKIDLNTRGGCDTYGWLFTAKNAGRLDGISIFKHLDGLFDRLTKATRDLTFLAVALDKEHYLKPEHVTKIVLATDLDFAEEGHDYTRFDLSLIPENHVFTEAELAHIDSHLNPNSRIGAELVKRLAKQKAFSDNGLPGLVARINPNSVEGINGLRAVIAEHQLSKYSVGRFYSHGDPSRFPFSDVFNDLIKIREPYPDEIVHIAVERGFIDCGLIEEKSLSRYGNQFDQRMQVSIREDGIVTCTTGNLVAPTVDELIVELKKYASELRSETRSEQEYKERVTRGISKLESYRGPLTKHEETIRSEVSLGVETPDIDPSLAPAPLDR